MLHSSNQIIDPPQVRALPDRRNQAFRPQNQQTQKVARPQQRVPTQVVQETVIRNQPVKKVPNVYQATKALPALQIDAHPEEKLGPIVSARTLVHSQPQQTVQSLAKSYGAPQAAPEPPVTPGYTVPLKSPHPQKPLGVRKVVRKRPIHRPLPQTGKPLQYKDSSYPKYEYDPYPKDQVFHEGHDQVVQLFQDDEGYHSHDQSHLDTFNHPSHNALHGDQSKHGHPKSSHHNKHSHSPEVLSNNGYSTKNNKDHYVSEPTYHPAPTFKPYHGASAHKDDHLSSSKHNHAPVGYLPSHQYDITTESYKKIPHHSLKPYHGKSVHKVYDHLSSSNYNHASVGYSPPHQYDTTTESYKIFQVDHDYKSTNKGYNHGNSHGIHHIPSEKSNLHNNHYELPQKELYPKEPFSSKHSFNDHKKETHVFHSREQKPKGNSYASSKIKHNAHQNSNYDHFVPKRPKHSNKYPNSHHDHSQNHRYELPKHKHSAHQYQSPISSHSKKEHKSYSSPPKTNKQSYKDLHSQNSNHPSTNYDSQNPITYSDREFTVESGPLTVKDSYNQPKELYQEHRDAYPKPKDNVEQKHAYNEPQDPNQKRKNHHHETHNPYNKSPDPYHEPKDDYREPKDHYQKPINHHREIQDPYNKNPDPYDELKDDYNEPKDHYQKPKNHHHEIQDPYNKTPDPYHEPKDNYHEPKNPYQKHEIQDPYNRSPDPYHNPKKSHDEPGDTYHKSTSSYHEPKDTYSTSKDPYNEPKDPYHEPKDPYHEPKDPYHEPKDPYHEPKDPYHEPKDPYHEPKDPYHEPKDPYHEPKDPYHEPKDPYHEPKDSYHEPEDPYHEPKDPYHEPKDPYHEPELTFNEPQDHYTETKHPYKELKDTESYHKSKDPYHKQKDPHNGPEETFNYDKPKDTHHEQVHHLNSNINHPKTHQNGHDHSNSHGRQKSKTYGSHNIDDNLPKHKYTNHMYESPSFTEHQSLLVPEPLQKNSYHSGKVPLSSQDVKEESNLHDFHGKNHHLPKHSYSNHKYKSPPVLDERSHKDHHKSEHSVSSLSKSHVPVHEYLSHEQKSQEEYDVKPLPTHEYSHHRYESPFHDGDLKVEHSSGYKEEPSYSEMSGKSKHGVPKIAYESQHHIDQENSHSYDNDRPLLVEPIPEPHSHKPLYHPSDAYNPKEKDLAYSKPDDYHEDNIIHSKHGNSNPQIVNGYNAEHTVHSEAPKVPYHFDEPQIHSSNDVPHSYENLQDESTSSHYLQQEHTTLSYQNHQTYDSTQSPLITYQENVHSQHEHEHHPEELNHHFDSHIHNHPNNHSPSETQDIYEDPIHQDHHHEIQPHENPHNENIYDNYNSIDKSHQTNTHPSTHSHPVHPHPNAHEIQSIHPHDPHDTHHSESKHLVEHNSYSENQSSDPHESTNSLTNTHLIDSATSSYSHTNTSSYTKPLPPSDNEYSSKINTPHKSQHETDVSYTNIEHKDSIHPSDTASHHSDHYKSDHESHTTVESHTNHDTHSVHRQPDPQGSHIQTTLHHSDSHHDHHQGPIVAPVVNPKARQPIHPAPIGGPQLIHANPGPIQAQTDFLHFKPDQPDPYGSGEIVHLDHPIAPHSDPYAEPHHPPHPDHSSVIQYLEPHNEYQVEQAYPALNIDTIAKAAERCVDKIEYVEEIVQDEEIECHHTYEQKCQTTYTTDFEAVQEEECDDSFQKDCFIEYKKVAMNETVEVCHTPLVKDCNFPGPVECKTEYETMCETR